MKLNRKLILGLFLAISMLFTGPLVTKGFTATDVVDVDITDLMTLTAGEALSTGDIVYTKVSDGKAYKADTDLAIAASGVVRAGAGGSVASGALVVVARKGTIIGQTSLTVNGKVYINATAGAFDQTGITAFLQPIGIARNATTIDFDIDATWTTSFTDTSLDRWEVTNEFNDLTDFDVTNGWVLTTTEAGGGSATEVIQDALFGVLKFTNDAADNDLDSLQSKYEIFKLTASKRTIFKVRFKLANATEVDVILGLCIRDTTPLTATDYLYFVKDDGDTNWDFVSGIDSTETEVATVATADTSWHVFSIICKGTTSCTPYIDGTAGTAITTNLPTDEELAITVHIQNGEAVAKILELDYINLIQER